MRLLIQREVSFHKSKFTTAIRVCKLSLSYYNLVYSFATSPTFFAGLEILPLKYMENLKNPNSM